MNVTINNILSTIWTTNITIGTPKQDFQVQLDTGSDFLWVASKKCKYCEMQVRYNPFYSSTYQHQGLVVNVNVTYGEGECYGTEAYDIVGMDDTDISSNFELLAVSYETGFSYSADYSGVMGLSNNQLYQNIFQTGFQVGQVSSSIFGFSIQPLPFQSLLLYDQVDQKIMNEVTWIQIQNQNRWELPLLSVQYNGINQTLGNLTSGVLDSGTSCLVLEQNLFNDLVEKYFSKICTRSQNSYYYCPCRPTLEQVKYLPTITLEFPGVQVNVNYTSYYKFYYTQQFGYCEVCIQNISSSVAPFMIFGVPVFKSVIALFNKVNNQIGLYAP